MLEKGECHLVSKCPLRKRIHLYGNRFIKAASCVATNTVVPRRLIFCKMSLRPQPSHHPSFVVSSANKIDGSLMMALAIATLAALHQINKQDTDDPTWESNNIQTA